MSTLSRVIFDPDTTPPSVPLGVAATALSQSTIRVTWQLSTDTGGSGLAGYRVYSSATLAGTYTQISPDLSTASLIYDDGTLSASQQRFYKVLSFDGNGNASALSAAVNATTQAGTAPTTGIRFHPGHYGQLRTVAGVKTSESVILADLAVIAANAGEANIVGWAANFAWKQIETAPGVFDFTIPDRYFNACKAAGKRFIFRLDYRRYSGDGTQSVVPADMYPSGQVASADGGATPRDWEAAVMTRIIAAWLAVAAHYDADSMFEGVQGMVETSVSFDATYPQPANYTTANKKTQYKRWMDAMRGTGGFQYAQVWFGQNYLGDQNGSDCEEMIQYAIARRIGVGGPDTWQFDWVVPPAQTGKRPLWSDEVARGVRGSGTDYRLQELAWPREAQGTEMGGYIGNMLPQSILQSCNYDGSQWMIWDYNTAANNPGSTPATQWGNGSTQGILWVIRNQPVTNTTNPYPAAFDYYISASGSDSNPGTEASPWAITALNTKQSTYAGERVGLLNGIYNIQALMIARAPTAGDDTPGLQIRGGTVDSPTVIAAVNPRQAIITAKVGSVYGNKYAGNMMMGTRGLPTAQAEYITIKDLVFTGTNVVAVNMHDYSASTRARGIRVENNEIYDIDSSGDFDGFPGVPFSGANPSGITINACVDYVVRNNYIHDIYRSPRASSVDHLSSILVWRSSGGIIEHNRCIDTGNGIYGKETANEGHEIRYNYIDMTGSPAKTGATIGIQDFVGGTDSVGGIFPTATLTTEVHHNVVIASQPISMSPTLGWPGSTAWITPVICYNNTCIVRASGGASLGILIPTDTGDLTSYNNLVVTGFTVQLGVVFHTVGAQGLIDYNLYPSSNQSYVHGPTSAGTGYSSESTLAAWRTAMGSSAVDANSVLSNSPSFTNAGAFALQYTTPSGPAFNAGRVGGAGSTQTNIGALDGTGTPGCDF